DKDLDDLRRLENEFHRNRAEDSHFLSFNTKSSPGANRRTTAAPTPPELVKLEIVHWVQVMHHRHKLPSPTPPPTCTASSSISLTLSHLTAGRLLLFHFPLQRSSSHLSPCVQAEEVRRGGRSEQAGRHQTAENEQEAPRVLSGNACREEETFRRSATSDLRPPTSSRLDEPTCTSRSAPGSDSWVLDTSLSSSPSVSGLLGVVSPPCSVHGTGRVCNSH
ncbi:unnamed protein product, partial [Pleuronectes platessa]